MLHLNISRVLDSSVDQLKTVNSVIQPVQKTSLVIVLRERKHELNDAFRDIPTLFLLSSCTSSQTPPP